MAKAIDVYREWLGIAETARPLNYYQLLRLKPFEDGVPRIRDHYRKLNARVRQYATGDYAEASQRLLNELAKAMLCLTDAQRKREYDASLGRQEAGEGRRRTFEEILLANKVIDQAQLAKARNFAGAVGLELHDAVVQQKLASPDAVMLCYAESIGLPYVELAEIGVAEALVGTIPPTLARQHSCVPVMVDGNQLLMASPNPLVPDVEEELRLRCGMAVRTVLCTAASVNAAIARFFPRESAQAEAQMAKARRKPARQAAEEEEEQAPSRPAIAPEELVTQRLSYSFIAFNIGVVAAVLAQYMLRSGPIMQMWWSIMVIALVVGLLAAAGTFVVMMRK